MTNISLGGVGISYPLAAETGIKLKILFSIPTGSKSIPVTADVIISYVHFSNNAFQVGLQFEKISEQDILVVSSFIRKKLLQKKYSQKFVTANNKY